MFDEDDPFLIRFRGIALGFPDAAEKVSHGRPAFFTAKVFAYYGGLLKVADTWVRHDQSVLVLLDRAEREAYLSSPRAYVPGYLGTSGWIGVDVDEDQSRWRELTELVDMSYRNTASPGLIRELDGR